MDDPLDWDVERVVRELCSPNRTWKPSSTLLKLPPLDQLEAILRTHEVDGEVLLTYDHADLCADLGLKILKHKSTLKNVIQDIRLLSKKYRLHQKRQASELGEDSEHAEDAKAGEPGKHAGSAMKQTEDSSPDDLVLHASAKPSHPVANMSASKAEVSPLVTEEPAPKKRRVAPTIISANVDPNVVRSIPTEADVISSHKGPSQPSTNVAGRDLSEQYLGDDAISRVEILDDTSYAEMNLFQAGQMPRGRCLQLHRLMKRRLLRKQNYQQRIQVKSDVVPGGDNPDHNEVLPLYGDSDEEYDSETWEEMKAEEQAKLTSDNRPKGMTAEEITAVLDETLERFACDWREYKLPKVARKANRLWNDARRFGLKKEIDRARNDLRHYESRIAKYREEFQGPGQQWRNSGELKRTAAIFEQTVVDKEYSSWLLDILSSPNEPKKAASLPRQPTRRPRAPRPTVDDDEEFLTSESEGGIDDFIVDDEDLSLATAEYGSPMDIVDDIPQTQAQDDTVNGKHRDTTPMDVEVTGSAHLTQKPEMAKASSGTPSRSQKFEIIDLTTPRKQTAAPNIQSASKGSRPPTRFIIKNRNSSRYEESGPLIMPIDDLNSAEQKVALALKDLDQTYISLIFSLVTSASANVIWLDFVLRVLDNEEFPKAPYNTYDKKDALVSYTFIRLFEIYKDNVTYRLGRYKQLDDLGKQRIRDLRSTGNAEDFESFIKFLFWLADRFHWYPYGRHKKTQTPTALVLEEGQKERDSASTESSDPDATTSDMNTDVDKPSSSKKTKRRKLVRNQEAANLREIDQARIVEQTRRQQILRSRLQVLEASGEIDANSQTAMIINESKSDDQGLIYVHKEIAQRIKTHQLSGVRFMWNQIVDAGTRQGCLLAHTMGLGKTMQIITLLVAISQASHSPDPTISSQIPEELRESRTLVLCPPTLVNNWIDELLSWVPETEQTNLGDIWKFDSSTPLDAREHIVNAWGERGGILVVGYTLFKRSAKIPHLGRILLDKPSIVVADEAHMLKNPKSQLHMATSNFKTGSRIALTGSPLANNVEEYYSMINWVANNYLGSIHEFRVRYGIPIKEGLSIDSSSAQRRKALRMLHVLKSEAAPKVNRITIAVLKNDIPTKKEFVLMVPITELQRKAYEMYIEYRGEDKSSAGTFAATDTLGLICSHPFVFMAKLQELRKMQKDNSNNKNALDDDGSANVTLPQQLISDELVLLRNAKRELTVDEFSLSQKIPLLFAILKECKKVRDSVLLFSHQIATLDYLGRALRDRKYSFLRLDGQTQMNQRQTLVKDFNQGDVDIFLISTAAGGLGLNIVGANRVIIFDVKFNPQAEQQAVGRAYRIGQKKPVFVYRFVCGGTFEEKLLHQAIWKMQLASRVVDKKHPIPKAQSFNEGFDKPKEITQQDLSEYRGKDDVLDNVLERPDTDIRSITMMDTFEEEALEDAELSPEDRQEADEIIKQNEARRLGKPIPHHHDLASRYSDGLQGSRLGPPIDLSGVQVLLASPLAGRFPSTSDNQSTQAHPESTIPNTNAPLTQNNIQTITSQIRTMTPVQRVTPHMQSATSSADNAAHIPGSNWEIWQPFKGELSRAFTNNTVGNELDKRSEIVQVIASKVWEQAEQQQPELRSAIKWAVMNAASSSRFVEAVCMGIIDPDQLAQMPPAGITAQRTSWDKLDDAEWEGYKNTGRQSNGDPKHLEYALRRMTSIPTEDGHSQGERSHRVDDQKAVEAVLERRKAKQYSQPKPDLPIWAKNAVAKSAVPKQGQIAAPSSSASFQPSSSSRPSASNPFK